jgi:anthranilate synthase component II
MKVLMLDNYDSFTYNLVHILQALGTEVDVFRNDTIAVEDAAGYDKIILSPGPGLPEESGILLPLIARYAAEKSFLGVCLGHQAIGEVFGGKLVNMDQVVHGKAKNTIVVQSDLLFDGLPEQFETGRYHSWVVDRATFPDALEITAIDDDGFVMALRHRQYNVRGVQFHPESVMTPDGKKMLENWLKS